eukprot:UN20441
MSVKSTKTPLGAFKKSSCLECNHLTMTAHCENKCYVFFQIST